MKEVSLALSVVPYKMRTTSARCDAGAIILQSKIWAFSNISKELSEFGHSDDVKTRIWILDTVGYIVFEVLVRVVC